MCTAEARFSESSSISIILEYDAIFLNSTILNIRLLLVASKTSSPFLRSLMLLLKSESSISIRGQFFSTKKAISSSHEGIFPNIIPTTLDL